MICKFAPALVILISQGPGSLHETEFATDGSRKKKKRDVNKGTSYSCGCQVRGTSKGE